MTDKQIFEYLQKCLKYDKLRIIHAAYCDQVTYSNDRFVYIFDKMRVCSTTRNIILYKYGTDAEIFKIYFNGFDMSARYRLKGRYMFDAIDSRHFIPHIRKHKIEKVLYSQL
jgi:hypothetical protein